jgi:hypothetical protein
VPPRITPNAPRRFTPQVSTPPAAAPSGGPIDRLETPRPFEPLRFHPAAASLLDRDLGIRVRLDLHRELGALGVASGGDRTSLVERALARGGERHAGSFVAAARALQLSDAGEIGQLFQRTPAEWARIPRELERIALGDRTDRQDIHTQLLARPVSQWSSTWAMARLVIATGSSEHQVARAFKTVGQQYWFERPIIRRRAERLERLGFDERSIEFMSFYRTDVGLTLLKLADQLGLQGVPRENRMRLLEPAAMLPDIAQHYGKLGALFDRAAIPATTRAAISEALCPTTGDWRDNTGSQTRQLLDALEPFHAQRGVLREVLRAVAEVPLEARGFFIETAMPIFKREGELGERLRRVTNLSAEFRATVLALTPAAVNPENVMDARRMRLAIVSINALQALFPTVDRDASLKALKAHLLEHGQNSFYGHTDPDKKVIRTNLDHALHVLNGPRLDGVDLSGSLEQNETFSRDGFQIGVGDLAALWWTAASALPDPHERENARYSVGRALVDCIEDDGHRVCNVGITQRLVRALRGYYPQVQPDPLSAAQVLQVTADELKREHGEKPSEEALAAFPEKVQRMAADHLDLETDEARELPDEVARFLDLTYDWPPRSSGEGSTSP